MTLNSVNSLHFPDFFFHDKYRRIPRTGRFFNIFEHISAPVLAVLVSVMFLTSKAIVPPTQVCQLTILKVAWLAPLKDQQLLCPAYVQPEDLVTILNSTFDFFSEAFFMVYF